jgi:hypothetical protein
LPPKTKRNNLLFDDFRISINDDQFNRELEAEDDIG